MLRAATGRRKPRPAAADSEALDLRSQRGSEALDLRPQQRFSPAPFWYNPRMHVLKLRGGSALSEFRLDKLNRLIAGAGSALLVRSGTYWHFVEVARDPEPGERDVLDRLLTYGPRIQDSGFGIQPSRVSEDGASVLIAPRIGTISPWSSKATDIARQCGLDFVRRIERGTVFHLDGARRSRGGPALPARPDDGDRAARARRRRRAVPPRGAEAAHRGRRARPRRGGDRGGEPALRPRAGAGRDRLPRRATSRPRGATRPTSSSRCSRRRTRSTAATRSSTRRG